MVQLARPGQISDITRSSQLLHIGSIIKTTFLVFHKKNQFQRFGDYKTTFISECHSAIH